MILEEICATVRVQADNALSGYHYDEEFTIMIDPSELPFKLADEADVKAEVGLTLGGTYNMGNFNMARVQVNVTVPCHVGDIERAYQFCQGFAEDKVVQYRNQLGY